MKTVTAKPLGGAEAECPYCHQRNFVTRGLGSCFCQHYARHDGFRSFEFLSTVELAIAAWRNRGTLSIGCPVDGKYSISINGRAPVRISEEELREIYAALKMAEEPT